ncbi:MAG: DUF427 domain-containing protein [Myxococcales bacterium]|nr:DUF427 domain-containing protein [Myxococcales bacterium]
MSDVRFEPCPRRVRALVKGQVVIDSTRVRYGWPVDGPPYPVYYVPLDDVRTELLEAHGLTEAVHGEQDGHVTFRWSAFDTILEEAEEVFVHPRSPYSRVDVLGSDRRVQVFVAGEEVADSRRAKLLFETGLPTRYYLPQTDVRMDKLTPTDTSTGCPYKGFARYWSVSAGGAEHPDIAWGYTTPLLEVCQIAGLVCFYNEKVDIVVDGVKQERPRTPLS